MECKQNMSGGKRENLWHFPKYTKEHLFMGKEANGNVLIQITLGVKRHENPKS